MARGVAQWVKVLATKPNNLSSIPRLYMRERETWLPKIVFWSPYVHHGMSACMCMSVCTCREHTPSEGRDIGSLSLERVLQAVMSCLTGVLGTEHGSSPSTRQSSWPLSHLSSLHDWFVFGEIDAPSGSVCTQSNEIVPQNSKELES